MTWHPRLIWRNEEKRAKSPWSWIAVDPLQQEQWPPEEEEETVDYNLDELDDIIEEIAGPKAQAITVPSLAEENGDTMLGLGASSTNSCTTGPELSESRIEWEKM